MLQADFVLNEIGLFGQCVVQLLGGVVVAGGDPIQAATPFLLGQILGGLYQCPPQALATHLRIYTQVFQITTGLGAPGVGVKHQMGKACQSTLHKHAQAEHVGLGWVCESLPCVKGDGFV